MVPLPLNQVEIRGPCRVRIPEGTKLRTNPDLTVFDVQKVGPESIGVSTGRSLKPMERTPRLWFDSLWVRHVISTQG